MSLHQRDLLSSYLCIVCWSCWDAFEKYIVEEKLTNGSIGTVKEIVYDNPRVPNIVGNLPLYVVVDFKESTLRKSLLPDCPTTYVHVPVVNDIYERKCFTIYSIPLRFCKELNIYKIQGLTVGSVKGWEHAIVG